MSNRDAPDASGDAPATRQRRVPDLASLLDIDALSALALENSAYDVPDVAARRVSYVMLCEAGVAPLAADTLRRRYSLVWSFQWTYGAHLLQRATQLRTLHEAERAWIAASAPADCRRDYRERSRWETIRRTADENASLEARVENATPDTSSCPRCEADLVTYALDGCEAVRCDGCGYARLGTTHGGDAPAEQSWTGAVQRFLDDQ